MSDKLLTANTSAFLGRFGLLRALIEDVVHIKILNSPPIKLIPFTLVPRGAYLQHFTFSLLDCVFLVAIDASQVDLNAISPRDIPETGCTSPSEASW
jgi:hypothetical protein